MWIAEWLLRKWPPAPAEVGLKAGWGLSWQIVRFDLCFIHLICVKDLEDLLSSTRSIKAKSNCKIWFGFYTSPGRKVQRAASKWCCCDLSSFYRVQGISWGTSGMVWRGVSHPQVLLAPAALGHKNRELSDLHQPQEVRKSMEQPLQLLFKTKQAKPTKCEELEVLNPWKACNDYTVNIFRAGISWMCRFFYISFCSNVVTWEVNEGSTVGSIPWVWKQIRVLAEVTASRSSDGSAGLPRKGRLKEQSCNCPHL